MGERLEHLKQAVKSLNDSDGISVEKVSSIYETAPWGVKDQGNFLNAVIKIKTVQNFSDLFYNLKRIEKEIGRKKTIRYGPREIDLDLLFFNDLIYSDQDLTIPHKGAAERDFVLVPLCEIAEDLIHPVLKKKICDICINESENSIIKKMMEKIL